MTKVEHRAPPRRNGREEPEGVLEGVRLEKNLCPGDLPSHIHFSYYRANWQRCWGLGDGRVALRVARGLQVHIPRPRLQEALGLTEGPLPVPHRVKYEGKEGVKTKQPEFCLEAPFTQRVEDFKGIQNLL